MLAGHTLLKLISTLVWGVFSSFTLLSWLSIVPFILLILLTGLEIVIAFVQAYVFILLTCSVLPKVM
jgi:F-type H+-transporting ATPase subunit a